ncbi:hypothetical protein [Pseudobacteriovorax antillogorgiicola]|uniref:Uncharacterized protein n=1 Tax=Pseudobacteriovorax antillogorgiicola TaxID=1513793 RepID=A0A1Y6CD59_9BACT|nr:hypothetical protein [Pseudobacteriovorax antillogorgiicola]TCS49426.1 hypothetical protein EDD56_115107 [Pseudobacteriovorax antillogorgiicola]SMF46764.1 hypothetical protein SAMN06296036_11477 [Pseudobacteriovorax antillogorgiicola]
MIRDSIIIAFTVLLSTAMYGQEAVPGMGQGYAVVEGKDFAMKPPAGWEVAKEINGASLFFQAPDIEGDIYRRNIRVMSFSGPRYLDDVSFEEFAKEIQENSSKISNALKSYQIRDLTPVDLSAEVKGGLFYADFTLNQVPMMQMHILVSSAEHHFLMTYTDTRERFENTSNGLLDEAYQSMQSVRIKTKPPARTDFALKIGIGVTLVVVSFISVTVFRRHRVKQLGHGLDEYGEDEDAVEPTQKVEEEATHLEADGEAWSDDEPPKSDISTDGWHDEEAPKSEIVADEWKDEEPAKADPVADEWQDEEMPKSEVIADDWKDEAPTKNDVVADDWQDEEVAPVEDTKAKKPKREKKPKKAKKKKNIYDLDEEDEAALGGDDDDSDGWKIS